MSIRSKILAVLGAVTLLYVGLDQLLVRFRLSDAFQQLELDQARHAFERVAKDLEEERELLVAAARRWNAAAQRGEIGPDSHQLPRGFLATSDVDLVYWCAPSGRVLWGEILDPDSREPIDLRLFPRQALNPAHPALHWIGADAVHHGLALTDRGMLALVSLRCEQGTQAQTLILGRFLGPALADRIGRRHGAQVRLLSIDWEGGGLDPQLQANLAVSEGGVALGTIGEDWAVLGQYLSDWEGRDSILLQARFPYRFAPTIADLKRYALLSSAAVAMLILVVLLRLLERVVVRPLGRLTRYSVEIGKGGPRSAVPASTGADELGTLSREIERMLDRLEELRRAAADASRQAGKSEVATYVLHNVGNALNGATVSTGMVRVAVEQMAIDRIERVADVLEQEAHDLPRFFAAGGRGPHLVPYARQLAGALAKQRSEVLAELVRLEETMQRVVTIVLAQKSLVGGPGYPERLALAAQIEEVMEVVRSGPEGAAVQWQRAFEDVPMAVLDRHRLMEILLVLLRNACEAARAAQLSRAVVTVRLRALDDRRLCIEVEDNGAELPPEERLLIFAGGGTHPPGSRGCGLHQASNAATELGGRLEAESPGGGAGMRFRLELPLQPGPACPTREPAGPQALPLLARQVAAMGETSQ